MREILLGSNSTFAENCSDLFFVEQILFNKIIVIISVNDKEFLSCMKDMKKA